jgi:hypothetical protein
VSIFTSVEALIVGYEVLEDQNVNEAAMVSCDWSRLVQVVSFVTRLGWAAQVCVTVYAGTNIGIYELIKDVDVRWTIANCYI